MQHPVGGLHHVQQQLQLDPQQAADAKLLAMQITENAALLPGSGILNSNGQLVVSGNPLLPVNLAQVILTK